MCSECEYVAFRKAHAVMYPPTFTSRFHPWTIFMYHAPQSSSTASILHPAGALSHSALPPSHLSLSAPHRSTGGLTEPNLMMLFWPQNV